MEERKGKERKVGKGRKGNKREEKKGGKEWKGMTFTSLTH